MDTKSTTSSRSFTILFLLLFIIAISALVPAKWFGIQPKKPAYTQLDLSEMTSPTASIQDTNKDGKISWGEVVNSTMKDSPSTLAQVKAEPIDQKSINELNDPNNLTADFSKNLYLSTAYMREKGINDEGSRQAAINYLIQKEAEKIEKTNYTPKDIYISTKESKGSIQKYGNDIAGLIKQVISQKDIENDLSSLSKFTQSRDEKDLELIIKNRDNLNLTLKKLLVIEVPPSAVTYHILSLNRIAHYRDVLDNFSKSASDPVRGTLAVDSYFDTVMLTLHIPNNFSEYFSMQNIVFTNKEPGYIFTIGYSYK